jgi:hypothetical protein
MSASRTDNYLNILRKASAQTEDEAFWISITRDVLGLRLAYMPAVYETIRQGRWKKATDPTRYLKTAAKREAVKQGLIESRTDKRLISLSSGTSQQGKSISPENYFDYLLPQGGIQKKQGKWRAVPDDYPEQTLEDQLWEKLPAELKHEELFLISLSDDAADEAEPLYELSSRVSANGDRLADLGELDEWQRRVLQYRLKGVSRERAMAAQSGRADRNKLQAAWRRFDRDGKAKLCAVVKKFIFDVPEVNDPDTT